MVKGRADECTYTGDTACDVAPGEVEQQLELLVAVKTGSHSDSGAVGHSSV